MINLLMSTLCFLLMLGLGQICMFTTSYAYLLILPFLFGLILIKGSYQANCKPIERKDFFYSLLFTIIFNCIYLYLGIEINRNIFSYLYLSTFVSLLMYACGIRYKSLI